MILNAGQFQFRFPRPALIMGILNVTPDSFSDGGAWLDPTNAIDHARRMIAEGAEIIDVGGESTRPDALPVPEDEELRRVLPIIERLAPLNVPISIDTIKPNVAKAALQAGASFLNDVAANRPGPEMMELARDFGAAYVLMHMQGTPQTMQASPSYVNVLADLKTFFLGNFTKASQIGLAFEQIIVDVGIGFGKKLDHNLALLGGLEEFASLGRPQLLGVSRKSFMQKLLGLDVNQRLHPSVACACWAVSRGVQIIRTHDVAPTVQAVRMIEAIAYPKS